MNNLITSLLEVRTGESVPATVRTDMYPDEFRSIMQAWEESKQKYREILIRDGKSVPPSDHWNWEDKASGTTPDLHQFVGIATDDGVQGLMMLARTAETSRRKFHRRERVLYVEYIESAPWNLPEYMGDSPRYKGAGTALLRVAATISIAWGWDGRVGLHSLSAAENFYRKAGLENCGFDAVENLSWFELPGVTIS